MHFLNKLEKSLGKFAIKGLMKYIVAFNLAVFLLMFVDPTGSLVSKLMLYPDRVMKGEVWRLITYIFIPPSTSPFWILFTLYFYYMVGSALENEWGSFKFNVYYLVGMIGTTISSFITGAAGTAYYLNMSLFLAFAFIYPDYQILIFFFLPVKMKYLAWLDIILLGISFIGGSFAARLAIIAAIANYLLFFGKDMMLAIKNRGNAYSNRQRFARSMPRIEAFHKCTICGITEKDDKNMEFRYCSKCEGDYEYCMDHLKNHEHIRKEA
ncbi:hypothetical protein CDQ83_07155 [Clostridium thermosuccinogenes]|nr:rhomboid family intramembrane serine protease [Pseudoclostridium thermosuccinogenes]PNT93287.1 hypothetical protein CDQ83_07155 [Pseudoclostridium thermosuccinogenes]